MMDRHLDNHAWRSPSAKTGVKKINLKIKNIINYSKIL